MENPQGKFPAEFNTYKVVDPNNLIFCLFDIEETPRTVGHASQRGMITGAYMVVECVSNINSRYVYYYYLSLDFDKRLQPLYTGLRKVIQKDTLFSIKTPIPSIEEQNRIVEFLDRTTAEIDEAIAKKKRLIELLQEQKAILINQAVTKGLNPKAPMRDSGVEWIGEIPEHWEIKRLSFLANLLQTVPFGSQLHQEDYIEGGIPVINPSQIINGEIQPDYKISVSEKTALQLARHQLIKGDIVFGRRGEMGRCALVSAEHFGWLCGTGSILFRPKKDLIIPDFALIALRCDFMKSNLEFISVGATMDNLNTSILSKVSLPLPSKEEQAEIIQKVQAITRQYSSLINREIATINLLHELKQVVVAQVVTGKVKV